MPRRKKKFMLLRSEYGSFIVVERKWYDYTGIAKLRGDRKQWWIAAQSNDRVMLEKMAGLTGKHLKMEVNHVHEQDGVVTRRE